MHILNVLDNLARLIYKINTKQPPLCQEYVAQFFIDSSSLSLLVEVLIADE